MRVEIVGCRPSWFLWGVVEILRRKDWIKDVRGRGSGLRKARADAIMSGLH